MTGGHVDGEALHLDLRAGHLEGAQGVLDRGFDIAVDGSQRVLGPHRDPEVTEPARPGRSEGVAEAAVALGRPHGGLEDRDEITRLPYLGSRTSEVKLSPPPHTRSAPHMADERNGPPGHLVSVQAVEVRRNPGRAADLRAEAEDGQPRGRRHGATAGGTSRCAVGVARVQRQPEQRVVRLDVLVSRGHVGLADDHRTRGTQPPYRLGVLIGDVLLEIRPSAGRPQPGGLVAGLERDGQAVKGPEFRLTRTFRIRVPGITPRPSDVEGDDRVQRCVVGVDPAQVDVEQFLAGDLT
ncbi:hypothetical protein PV333_38740 [Streptomyces sp. NY05-11A]|nr:hypothetical protein [Streptomyces sp. NY05-11A]